MNQQTVQPYGTWIGLYRKPSAGNAFYWIDDTPLAGQYSAWVSGEPSYVVEKCVHTYIAWKKNRDGEWNDNRCNLHELKRRFAPVILCQKHKYI